MDGLRNCYLSVKLSLWAFNGSAARLSLLVGCIVGAIAISERVQAHGCADGTTFIGVWRATTPNGTATPGVLREFTWGLNVAEGEGHAYEAALYSRDVVNGVATGAWSLDYAPSRIPTAAYFLWCMQLAVAYPEDACRIECFLGFEDALRCSVSGWSFAVPIEWLTNDNDNDGIPNLDDPQALLACDGDIFEPGACPLPIGSEIGVDDWDINYVSPTTAVGFPYATGAQSIGYACDAVLAYGGSTPSGYAGLTYANMFEKWAREEWRAAGVMGQPVQAKPYEGAYNMVRAGAGGGETAYFSACWGKRITYILEAATVSTAGNNVRYGDYKWHRYVVVDGKWYFQWWSGTCWKSIGIYVSANLVAGTYVLPYIEYTNTTVSPKKLVPNGYLPGDVVGETYSNTESGLFVIPSNEYNGLLSPYGTQQVLGGPLVTGGTSGSSGGASIDYNALENAFGNALRSAGVGGGSDAALASIGTGEGAVDAAIGVYGMTGVGDNGVGDGVAAAAGFDRDVFGEGLTDSLGLSAITPAENVAGVFDFSFDIPGAGVQTFSISTMPDTSTAWGVVLEGFRVLIRLGIATWWSILLGFKLIAMYKEIT